MQEILPQLNAVAGICGRQSVAQGWYGLSHYCLRVSVDEGELLYHNMTGELLLLSAEEAACMFERLSVRDELITRWFVVPEGFNEHQLARQTREIALLVGSREPEAAHFVVFPTTDCKARCFYCYELGRPRRHMSDKVAYDAAAYIVRRASGRDVGINWFGGEPLYNARAIDIITRKLAGEGVSFTSQMTTNGYLFDDELVRHARADWALDTVQITLDGTESVYNRTKSFVEVEGSAHRRVLRNVALLSDAGISVSLRLNLNGSNEHDLWHLADELAERFGERDNVTAYTVLLRDFGFGNLSHESRHRALAAYDALQRHLHDVGVGKPWYPRQSVSVNQCMADNDSWITILPDGRLGKCEHESEDKLVVSIYGDRIDDEAVRAWKQVVRVPECEGCLFFPSCIRLRECAWHSEGCTAYDREEMRINLRHRVLNAYEKYLSRRQGCKFT